MSQSKSINDTTINRLLLFAAIKLIRPWRRNPGTVLMLSKRLCVKYGPYVGLPEAAAMQFIAARTSIPVPRVYCAFEYKGRTFILMERLDGRYLAWRWVSRSEESKERLHSQVRQMIREMRKITPPTDCGVSNVDGGRIYDGRLPGPTLHHGPFRSVEEFHRHLRNDFKPHPNLDDDVNKLIDLQEAADWPLTFTHGDLSSLNILAHGDKITGIVDWETAGWFPEYWEYTTACQVNPQNEFWRAEIERFLDPYPKELEMEEIRRKYFGDF